MSVHPTSRLVAGLLVLLTGVGACSSEEPRGPRAERPDEERSRSARPTSPGSPATRPTREPKATEEPEPEQVFDTWVVGAEPLPLRDDGFGQVLPTPPQLRVRLMRTPDVLPPPDGPGYDATQRPVTPALARRTELAWFPGCPVELADLRLLELSFWGFDGRPHTGRLVVNGTVADQVVAIFGELYDARFPIEEMRLVTRADLDAAPTGDGNTTAAYACRPVRGSTEWSAHAYGLAVDVNPFMNPYRDGDLVLPELASAYLDRGWRRPGMIFEDGPVVRAFERYGWTWGGDFQSVLDLHHFSANGR